MADIFNFGTIVIRGQQLDFVPSHLIQLETGCQKAMPARLSENGVRKELLLSKMSKLT